MLSHPMPRSRLLPWVAVLAVLAAACGEQGLSLTNDSPHYSGAVLFTQRCSGCHTLAVAGTEGSATNVRTREYKDGPNFNQRKETFNCILYAIRNGGFSGGPMPQDIVTGQEAQQVAKFVANNSGKQAKAPATPQGTSGNNPTDCPAG
jgi:mono/diheme cytochrome c family protein